MVLVCFPSLHDDELHDDVFERTRDRRRFCLLCIFKVRGPDSYFLEFFENWNFNRIFLTADGSKFCNILLWLNLGYKIGIIKENMYKKCTYFRNPSNVNQC